MFEEDSIKITESSGRPDGFEPMKYSKRTKFSEYSKGINI